VNSVLLRLTLANLKMIARNRQSLFWSMAFPLIFVSVFGLFFSGNDNATTEVGLVDHASDAASARVAEHLSQTPNLVIIRFEEEATPRELVAQGDLGFLIVVPAGFQATIEGSGPPATAVLVYDDSDPLAGVFIGSAQRLFDRMNMEIAEAPTRVTLQAEGVLSVDVSYFDFLLPGLAIWGIMSFSVIGLATTLASYREKKIFDRILATPLRVSVFFASQVIAYLILALTQAAIILGFGALVFGVSINGSLLYIGLLILLGNIVFLNLGFIVGSYSKTVQAASGLGNAVVLPMMFFSGVFFPTDGLPWVLQRVVDFFPLAPLLEAIRGVTLEARPFWDFPLQLAILVAWVVISALLAVRLFRFRQ
jgi:ABC-2 type transport system permease protein